MLIAAKPKRLKRTRGGILIAAALTLLASVAAATPSQAAPSHALTATKSFRVATPTIAGTPRTGVTLTARVGNWKPTPTKVRYQWYVNGRPAHGATKKTFTVSASQLAKAIAVKVTVSRTGYRTVSKTSKRTGKVSPAVLRSSAPRIVGAPVVGTPLLAAVAGWTEGTKFVYQWLRDEAAIAGASSSQYSVSSADVGHTLTVRVTGSKPGYTSVVRLSSASAVVADPYVQAFGEFAPMTFSGVGDDVVSVPEAIQFADMHASHGGERNFIVHDVDSDGDVGYDINAIGRYSGDVEIGLDDPVSGKVNYLTISADGPWQITLSPLSSVPALPQSGLGSGVFRYDGPATPWVVSRAGQHNFVVNQFALDGDQNLLINTIGPYAGTVLAAAGPGIVVVEDDQSDYGDLPQGSWTIAH